MDVAVGGGVDSISLVQNEHMNLHRAADEELLAMHKDIYMPMLQTAEVVAARYNVSRDAMDEYGLQSQQRAAADSARGKTLPGNGEDDRPFFDAKEAYDVSGYKNFKSRKELADAALLDRHWYPTNPESKTYQRTVRRSFTLVGVGLRHIRRRAVARRAARATPAPKERAWPRCRRRPARWSCSRPRGRRSPRPRSPSCRACSRS